MKKKKVIAIVFSIIAALIVLPIAFYATLVIIPVNAKRPAHIDNANGYVQASGRNLYDGEGNILQLKGFNLGDWFDQEWWMASSTVKGFETGVYTPKRGLAAMKANPNLNDSQIDELQKIYIDTFIQEVDFENIKDMNVNAVRIPFTCYNLTTDGYTYRENAFDKLDWVVDMCDKYGLYAIIDYHGAIGSQNNDNHSGADDEWNLYGNEKNENATIDVWKKLAERYKDRKIVAGYDLLNEPRRAANKYSGKLNFDFYDKLYDAVREIDTNHMIIMECFTFPIHGVNAKHYGWENVSYSYHIYNRTSINSQKLILDFYKALTNLMGYDVPIIIGEWSCWGEADKWKTSFKMFDKWNWSHISWTYKTNKYVYTHNKSGNLWSPYTIDVKPVNLYTATYDEIKETYLMTGTENASTTVIYDAYMEMYGK